MAEMSDKMAALRAAAEAKKAGRETAATEAEDAKSKEAAEAAERAAKREAVTAERDRVRGEAADARAELAAMTAEMGADLDPDMLASIEGDLASLDAQSAELGAQLAAFESGSVQPTTEAAPTVEAVVPEVPKEAVHEPLAETKTEAVEAPTAPADRLKADTKAFYAAVQKEFPEQQGQAMAMPEGTKAAGNALRAERTKLMKSIDDEMSAVMAKLDSLPGDQAGDTYWATIKALNASAVRFGSGEALPAAVEAGGYTRFSPAESKQVLRMIEDLVKLQDRRRQDSGGVYEEEPQEQTELYVLDQLAPGALGSMQKEDLQAIRDKVAKGFVFDRNRNRVRYVVSRGPGASGYFANESAKSSEEFLKDFDDFILNKAA